MNAKYKLTWRISDRIWQDEPAFDALCAQIAGETPLAEECNLFISEPTTHAYHPIADVRAKCESFRKAAAKLRALGLRVGIDQWPSFGAEESYQVEAQPREMPFSPMVGMNGEAAKRVACPISPEFLAYTREKFLLFAQAEPDFIWIDDDCRFTHLGGVPYPCFCPRCVAGFEDGAFASREALVDALNRPENGALRRRWSEYGAERLAEYCRCARAAVDEVNPDIDLPFMTVGDSHTTYAGDFIERCMAALRSRAGRPGHGFYWDEEPREMFEKALEAARQVLRYPAAARADVQYEEESCPGTPLNKAAHVRMLECALSIWAGCTGVAFNHLFPSSAARPFAHMRRELDMLSQNRAFLNQYFACARDLPMLGLWPADNEFMMAGMDVKPGGWFREKDPAYSTGKLNAEWPAMGTPVCVDKNSAFATLLQGKIVDTFTDAEIRAIFEKPVFMDADALAALEARGLGALAGVRLGASRMGMQEELTGAPENGEFAGEKHTGLFYPAHELIPQADSVEVLARATSARMADGGACATRYGTVTVFGYSPSRFTGTPGWQYRLRSLMRLCGAPVVIEPADAADIARISPWARGDGRRFAVLLIGASLDTAWDFDVCVRAPLKSARILDALGHETPLAPRQDGEYARVRIDRLGPWEMKVLLAET